MGRLIAVALSIVLALAGPCLAARHVVRPDGLGDYATIQAAVNAAAAGDTIELTDGTFSGEGNRDIDFGGKDLVVRSQSGDASTCIIDCGGSETVPHRGFYFHNGETTASVVEGITVENGYSGDEGFAHNGGGGFRIDGASPTIRWCVVTDCWAGATTCSSVGGAMCITGGGAPVIEHCEFRQSAGAHAGYGGGIGVFTGSPSIAWCTFEDNSASNAGGGLYLQDAAGATVEHCDFIGNTSSEGGGVRVTGGIVISNCTFVDNTATSTPSSGGGAGAVLSDGQLLNCTVVYNYSWGQGGGVLSKYGNPTLTNCIIAFNDGAPGVQAYRPEDIPTVECCDVWGNTSGNYDGVNVPDQTGLNGNISEDPLFCDVPSGDYTIDASSPCAPANNDCSVLIGALDVGCDAPVERASWSGIKALFR